MPCSECGAPVAGLEACGELMKELNARSAGDARFFIVHRIAADAYALQHPETHCQSAKSLAAHLVGICCAVEHAESLAVYSRMRSWLNGASDLPSLDPPPQRGAMTIFDVAATTDLEEHFRLVRSWGASVWEAWSDHHAAARRWIEEMDR